MMHIVHRYWIGGLLMLAGGLLAAAPATAETDADLSRYCRETFPNSAPTTRAPSGAPAHYCNQGGTLQGIDLARACELTTGSRDYRLLGTRVLCGEGPGPTRAAEPLTASDFVIYCRGKFANSFYQAVPDARGTAHHCRLVGAGGATLQPIDLAEACRTLRGAASYRVESNRVVCGDATGTAARRATAAGQGNGSSDNRDTDEPQDSGDTGEQTADAAPENPEQGGAKDSDQAKAKAAPVTSTDGRPTGVWTMMAGVFEGMKVRFDWKDDEMTAVITELPEKAAAVARGSYDLKVGDVVAVGRMQDGKLQLRTRLGIVGSRAWVAANCAGNLAFLDQMRDSRWTLPGWYPVYEMTVKAGRISGRHGGVEFVVPKGRPAGFDRCINNNAPFTPDAQIGAQMHRYVRNRIEVDPAYLLPNYAIKFELEQEVCSNPEDAPSLSLVSLFNQRRAEASRAAASHLGRQP